jgi:hypothetical protein
MARENGLEASRNAFGEEINRQGGIGQGGARGAEPAVVEEPTKATRSGGDPRLKARALPGVARRRGVRRRWRRRMAHPRWGGRISHP